MDILVKVRVAEGVEMEVRGGPEIFNDVLKQLPSWTSDLRSALAPTATATVSPTIVPTVSPVETIATETLPSIEKPKGTQDAILKVASTSWAKAKPRSWREIDEVLKTNGVHFSEGSLTGALTLLVQASKLRRLKVGGTYAYTLPLKDVSE